MAKGRASPGDGPRRAADEWGDGWTGRVPLETSSFVGREREMAELRGLLAEHRLLTLTGAGRCGKTYLALRVAGELAGGFVDGAWWAGLSSLSEPALVTQVVASALGVRGLANQDPTEAISRYLESKKTLLVLDNCEHLAGPCADLAYHLLRTCPYLRVLATSREPLGVAGETVFGVSPLALPDLERRYSAEELFLCESVRLFAERAKAANSAFALDDSNAPAVARLCVGLDGMPLTIELAAARARVLSAEQILERLDDRLDLLSTGPRTAEMRHRTLRATVDRSHDLLSEKEGILFRWACVFAGGFSLEAAEAVCPGGGIEGREVLDLRGLPEAA